MRVDELGKFSKESQKARTKGGGPGKEREAARFFAVMNAIPVELATLLSVQQLKVAFGFDLHAGTLAILKRDYLKRSGARKEAMMSGRTVVNGDAAVLIGRLARIATKTNAHKGDDEQIASEDALTMMLRELRAYDPALLGWAEKRSLPNQRRLEGVYKR